MFLFIFYKCWTYPYVISLLCLNNHAQVTVIQTQLLFCFLKTAFCVNDCFIFDPHALTGAVSCKLGPSRTSHPSDLCDPYHCFAHFGYVGLGVVLPIVLSYDSEPFSLFWEIDRFQFNSIQFKFRGGLS